MDRAPSSRVLYRLLPLLLLPLLGLPAQSVAQAVNETATLRISGSDTMSVIVRGWAKGFERTRSGVKVEVEGRGSSTGPPALLAGRAQIASMTRPMNDAELEAFRRRFGREPIAVVVGIDAVAVFVSVRNPLDRLTLAQLDAIFSAEPGCGAAAAATTWGDLGLEGAFADRRIGLYGRGPQTGTYDYFRNEVLCGEHFREGLRSQPGARSAAMSVSESSYGIGFASRTGLVPGVKALALSAGDGKPYATLNAGEVYSGAYPLGRPLYLYTAPPGEAGVDRHVLALVEIALSTAGQSAVQKAGYLEVPEEHRAEQLRNLR